jgi:hypothetical protein
VGVQHDAIVEDNLNIFAMSINALNGSTCTN